MGTWVWGHSLVWGLGEHGKGGGYASGDNYTGKVGKEHVERTARGLGSILIHDEGLFSLKVIFLGLDSKNKPVLFG